MFLCQGWESFKTRIMRTEFALSTGLTESGPICSLRSVFLLHFAATLRGHSGLWETKRNLLGVCVEVPSPRRTVLLDLRALPARLLVSAQSCNYTLGTERTFCQIKRRRLVPSDHLSLFTLHWETGRTSPSQWRRCHPCMALASLV